MGRGKGIGGHQRPYRGKDDSWITPKHILKALGQFDLDPCACTPQPWATAETMWTFDDDGYSREWVGRAFVNPPYGPLTIKWMRKLADHGNGIALIFARTETKMFFETVWRRATGCLFLEGRLFFCYPDGTPAKSNSGGPSVLVAYGEHNYQALLDSQLSGHPVRLKESP